MNTLQGFLHKGFNLAHRLDHILFEPPPAFTLPERRTTRLLALSSFVLMVFDIVAQMIFVSLLADFYATHSYFDDALFIVGVPTLILIFIAYIFSRTPYYRLSIALLIGAAISAPWLCAFISTEGALWSWAFYEIVALIIASMFVDTLGIGLLTGLVIVGQILLAVLRPTVFSADIVSTCITISCIGTVMILAQRHKSLLEKDRRQELTNANEVLAATNRALEHSIAEAEKARAAAEEANHLKSEFLAITSHELRTPLNSVIGFTVCMLNGIGVSGPELSEDQATLLRRVESNSKGLLGKINDVLDVSRIEAQRVDVSHEQLSLTALLDKAVAGIAPQAAEKGIALDADIDPDMPDTILGDEHLLSRVLQHLLANAVKFTHQGKIEISIKQADPDHWQLSVADTGIGIDPARQAIIFEPFRQVDGSVRRRYEGTGLGLTVVRGNLHLMSGEISVESQPGAGSLFTVTLPLMLP